MSLTNGDIRIRPAVDTAGRIRFCIDRRDDMGDWEWRYGPDFTHDQIRDHIAHLTQLIGEGP